MKKKNLIVLLCAILSAFSLKAQTLNAEYQYPGKLNSGMSTAVIPDESNSGPEAIYFNSVQRDTNGLYLDRCVITQVDPTTGSPMMAIERDTTNGIERIVATNDRHILAVSVFFDKLVVTKYDMSLSEVWATEVYHSGAPIHRGRNYVDIEKVLTPVYEGDEVRYIEDYYIAYPVYSAYGSWGSDYCPKVVRIDESGNLIWGKVYENSSSRPTILQDHACSITSFLDENEERRLAICGGQNTDLSGARLFVFLIDDMGGLASNYVGIQTGDIQPFLPDILADQQGQVLTIVYTEENSGTINPPPAGSANASGVGVIQLSFDLQNIHDARYFWHECENYGASISMASDGNYIIGGWASRCTPNQSPWEASPYFMKLTTGLSQMFYKRYNITTDGGYSQSVHMTDIADYNYILGHTGSLTPTFPPRVLSWNIRLIKADINGEACGYRDFEMAEITFEPALDEVEYEAVNDDSWTPTTVPFISVIPNYIVCDDGTKKPAGVDKVTYATVQAKVLPTLIQSRSTEQLQCSILSPVDGNIEIVIHNQVGQEVYRQQRAIAPGNTVVNIEASVLATGLNIVRIISNNQVVNTSKVVVAD